jgi:hypothetical protein
MLVVFIFPDSFRGSTKRPLSIRASLGNFVVEEAAVIMDLAGTIDISLLQL